jgi:acyl carrier protein
VKDKVRQKISTFLSQPLSNIRDDTVLTELVPESFLLVELVIELQEEFGIRLMQEDLKGVKTVGDLAEKLEKNAAAQNNSNV